MRTFMKHALWGALIAGGITLLGASAANAHESVGDDGLVTVTASDEALPAAEDRPVTGLVDDVTDAAAAGDAVTGTGDLPAETPVTPTDDPLVTVTDDAVTVADAVTLNTDEVASATDAVRVPEDAIVSVPRADATDGATAVSVSPDADATTGPTTGGTVLPGGSIDVQGDDESGTAIDVDPTTVDGTVSDGTASASAGDVTVGDGSSDDSASDDGTAGSRVTVDPVTPVRAQPNAPTSGSDADSGSDGAIIAVEGDRGGDATTTEPDADDGSARIGILGLAGESGLISADTDTGASPGVLPGAVLDEQPATGGEADVDTGTDVCTAAGLSASATGAAPRMELASFGGASLDPPAILLALVLVGIGALLLKRARRI